jgi:type IV pilus assembly protein PilC
MPSFTYRVITDSGAVLEKESDAVDMESLHRELEEKGCFVLNIRPSVYGESAAKGWGITKLPLFKKREIKTRDLIIFNQELLALIKAGLPILQCLDILIERIEKERLAEVLNKVREDVRAGGHLSESLAAHPQIPQLYTAFLRVGETSGTMVEVIQRYINYLKIVDNIRQKVINALIYPAILFAVVTAVVVFLLTFVVPIFAEMYKDFSSQLPLPTIILMRFTSFIKANIIPIGLFILCLAATFRMWLQTSSGKLKVWGIILKAPLIKDIIGRYFVSQLTRTLALVLGGGIPLVPALEIVYNSITNPILANKIKKAAAKVNEGTSLASAFESEGAMESLPNQMIHVGESTGSLEEMLKAIADLYDEEIALNITRLTTLMEPLLMLVMGVLVGVIVVTMYLPIFYMGGAAE